MPGKSNLLFYKNAGETESLLDKSNKGLLIAIDSDFDELCPNSITQNWANHQNSRFVLRTYAHGRENIIFSPECLHEILDKKFKLYLDNHDNPIFNIFKQLSAIWFEPYQKFLYLFNQKQYEYDDWISKIQVHKQKCQDIALKNDFSAYTSLLSEFDAEMNQQISNQDDFQTFCDELTNKSFNKENVWAFIRCHDFENKFVLPLMKEIVKNRQKQELGDVENHYVQNESGTRKQAVSNYFKEINNLQTILHHYFYDVYFDYAKNRNIFIKKIIADYGNLITVY